VRELDLAHPRPDRMEVCVLVFVEDEPPDQRGLADAALSHEGELCLHVSDRRHGETRAAPHSERGYKQFRRDDAVDSLLRASFRKASRAQNSIDRSAEVDSELRLTNVRIF